MRFPNKIISTVLSASLVIGLIPMQPTQVLADPDVPSAVEAVEETVPTGEPEITTEASDTLATSEDNNAEATAPTEQTPANDEATAPVDQEPDEPIPNEEVVPQDEPTVEEAEASI
ncbi:MAG: hypothetical protein IKE22_07975, partial [Atopobiaceae bacterium]|nr:hypothetical protein [Atopobiaceae bacterium]